MLLTLIPLLLTVTINSVFSFDHHNEIPSKASPSKCSTVECEMISNIFVHDVNKKVNPCEDPISYACPSNNISLSEKSTRKDLDFLAPTKILDSVLLYLNDTEAANQNSLRSLKIEQALFQQCMGYANDPTKATDKLKKILDYTKEVLIKIISNATWHTIDEELNTLDSERAFYEIKVSRNPLNPDQNIITLQPPSTISLAFKYFLALSYKRSFNDINSETKTFVTNFYLSLNDSIKITDKLKFEEELRKNKIGTEFQDFFQYFAGTLAGLSLNKTSNVSTWEYTELPNLIMSINKWNETYNLNGTIPEAASIDWLRVFNHEFKTVGIDVDGTELIYIKNKSYFDGLADIMSFKNSYTLKLAAAAVHGIRTILYRYLIINDAFSSNEELKFQRSNFCAFDNPLYGVSYLILNAWENEEINSRPQRTVLRNVVDSVKSFIQRSNISNVKKDFYLKRTDELSSIFFENKWNASYISNYYENYNLTDNYLMNMLNLQNVLKRKELSALRGNPDTAVEKVPFSIYNFDNSRDQFVLSLRTYYSKLNGMNLGFLPKYPIEFHYGTYGTEVANHLIKTLNTDKVNNGLTFDLITSIDFTFMKYNTEMFECFHSAVNSTSNNKPKPKEVTSIRGFLDSLFQDFIAQISETMNKTIFKHFYRIDNIIKYFGVSIAFEALQSNRRNNQSDVKGDRILKEAGLTSDQMFYLSHFKKFCSSPTGWGKFFSKFIPYSKRMSEAFQCPSQKLDLEKCKTLFEVDSIFLLPDNVTINQNVSMPLSVS